MITNHSVIHLIKDSLYFGVWHLCLNLCSRWFSHIRHLSHKEDEPSSRSVAKKSLSDVSLVLGTFLVKNKNKKKKIKRKEKEIMLHSHGSYPLTDSTHSVHQNPLYSHSLQFFVAKAVLTFLNLEFWFSSVAKRRHKQSPHFVTSSLI